MKFGEIEQVVFSQNEYQEVLPELLSMAEAENDLEKMDSVINDDPWVMYLIVSEELLPLMNSGKIAAMTAHGSEMLSLLFHKRKRELEELISSDPHQSAMGLISKIHAYENYLGTGTRKVVLKGDVKKFAKIKEEYPVDFAEVIDHGLTLIPPGSKTVLSLWPQKKSQSSKTLKRLQILK